MNTTTQSPPPVLELGELAKTFRPRAEGAVHAVEQVNLREPLTGAPIARIANRVHLSAGTVRNHLSSAIGKTDTSTRAEAARVAQDRGWI